MFQIRQFTQPPNGFDSGVAFPLETGNDGTITAASQRFSREDGWADATLVKAQYIDGSGVQQTAYQRHPSSGDNRAGKVQTINRAIPSFQLAAAYTVEAGRSGDSFRLTALADFRCKVGRNITITLAATGETITVKPDRIIYRVREGAMDVDGYVTA